MSAGRCFSLGVLLCGIAARLLTGQTGYEVLVVGIGCLIGAAIQHDDAQWRAANKRAAETEESPNSGGGAA